MRLFSSVQSYARPALSAALSLALAGCATVAVTPESIRPPDPSVAYNAIEAEPTPPAQVAIRDFDFASSSVTENRSLVHRAIDLLRSSSADDRRVAIGRDAAATLSKETAKRLGKTGLQTTRIAADTEVPLPGNFLLISGRLIDVDEGNRFTRVAFGFGLGESRLATQVHVFRVANGEKAEVLAFSTHADSGKMPGMAASMGFGVPAVGPDHPPHGNRGCPFQWAEDLHFPNRLPGRRNRRSGGALSIAILSGGTLDPPQ